MSNYTKKLRGSGDFPTELQLEQLNISLVDKQSYLAILTFFGDSLIQDGTLGKGILSYTGKWDSERTVFAGENSKLDNYMLAFISENSVNKLENFRENFVNVPANETMVLKWNVSKVEAYYLHNSTSLDDTEEKVLATFEETLRIQQKAVPKVVFKNKSLQIGGKSSASYLEFRGLTTADLKVKKIVSVIKSKGDEFLPLMVKNSQKSIKTIIAYIAVKRLSTLNQSDFIQQVRTNFIKAYEVGNIYTYEQVSQKTTTKSGKHISRSLKGIRNKLIKKEFSVETQEIFLSWLQELVSEDEKKILNASSFYQKICQTLGATSGTSSPISEASPLISEDNKVTKLVDERTTKKTSTSKS